MRLSRAKNTRRNIIVGEIDKISGILLPFFVRTLIIHIIGAEYLGLTGLFYSILQMLNLTEMGFGSAIVFSMYRPIAENDTASINALLAFYARVYHRIGIVVAFIGVAIMPFLRYMISGQIPSDINLQGLYLIYLINACIGFFVFPERKAFLSAMQRDDLSGRIHILTQLFMYIAQAVCVVLARNYYLYALMMPLTSVAYSLLCARRVACQFPEYKNEGSLEPSQLAEIKKQVAGLAIRKFAMLSRDSFDAIFVSAFLGLSATAIYSNYYYIMDSVVVMLAVVKTSMAGGVGNSIAMESTDKNLRDLHRINFLFMWIGGWCAICLLCLYQPFMKIWAGEGLMLPFSTAALFAVYFYVLKMSDIRTLYSESAGIWWQARYISVGEAVTNLALNWLFVQRMGIFGIILATLISYFLFNFLGGTVILFRYYFVDGGMWGFFGDHVIYAIVTSATAVAVYALTQCVALPGIPGFVIKAIICAIVPNVLFFLVYFRTERFKDCKVLISNFLGRHTEDHGGFT